MKKRIVSACFAVFSQIFFAQTGKEIIDKNIELSGGLVQWKLLSSVLLEGEVTLGLNDKYPIKIYQHRPNLTKTIVTVGKKETTVEGYDGKKGYAMNYATNKLQEYTNYNPESFDNDFIDFERKGFTAEYIGKEKVGNDGYCYRVVLTKNVNKTVYCFDTKTYMLLKEEKKEETLQYSDYRKVGALYFAFRIESTSNKKDGDYVMLFNKIATNKVFPRETFKF